MSHSLLVFFLTEENNAVIRTWSIVYSTRSTTWHAGTACACVRTSYVVAGVRPCVSVSTARARVVHVRCGRRGIGRSVDRSVRTRVGGGGAGPVNEPVGLDLVDQIERLSLCLALPRHNGWAAPTWCARFARPALHYTYVRTTPEMYTYSILPCTVCTWCTSCIVVGSPLF